MTLKTILVAVDFTETAGRALDIARTLADALGASLHLLHVVGCPLSTSLSVAGEQRDACRRLETLLDEHDRVRRHAVVRCAVGTPAHEIVQYATDNGVDLIVMGTHRHGPTYRMATGSIAETVLGAAPCAVLAVKAAAAPYTAVLDPPVAAVHA